MSLFPPLLPLSSIDSFFFPQFRVMFPPMPAIEPPIADDIADLGHAIQVSIQNPGIPLPNIQTKVDGNILTIHGQIQSQHQAEGKGFYSSQASQNAFTHRVKLPTDKVKSEQVKLRVDDNQNQLLVTLPKK